MFTIAQAITRLTSGPKNVFAANLTAPQQLQRVNEVLERFYEYGTWRGVNKKISLTSSGGIIILPPAYQRIETPSGLQDIGTAGQPNGVGNGGLIPIKSMQWAFSPSGPGATDWTKYWGLFAIDQGDVNGQHNYMLTGDPVTNDARTLIGLCRIRYVWATDSSTVVVPDCYQALRIGVYALGREDEGQDDDARKQFAEALGVLNRNMGEFEPEDRNITMSHMAGAGGLINLV